MYFCVSQCVNYLLQCIRLAESIVDENTEHLLSHILSVGREPKSSLTVSVSHEVAVRMMTGLRDPLPGRLTQSRAS